MAALRYQYWKVIYIMVIHTSKKVLRVKSGDMHIQFQFKSKT